jgi:biotin transport system permease protein
LHSVAPGVKLALLALVGSVMILFPLREILISVAVASAAIYISLGAAGRKGRGMVATSVVASGLVGLLNWWAGHPESAMTTALQLFAASTMGVIFTLTTRFDALLSTFERALSPLQRLGVDTGRLAFMLALMIRFVDHFFAVWQRLDEAHRLRTGRSGGIRIIAPLCIQMLDAAYRIADALFLRIGEPVAKPTAKATTDRRPQ